MTLTQQIEESKREIEHLKDENMQLGLEVLTSNRRVFKFKMTLHRIEA